VEVKQMPGIDLDAIMRLKKTAMKRCEERIIEAASLPPDQKRTEKECTESYGVTRLLKKRHGL
jgi:hypothetical protein